MRVYIAFYLWEYVLGVYSSEDKAEAALRAEGHWGDAGTSVLGYTVDTPK